MEILVTKVTLGTGKVVFLREPTVDDMEKATQIAGKMAGQNVGQMGTILQKELLKKALVQVGEKKLTAAEKEGVNNLFSLREYTQVMKVLRDLCGIDEQEGNYQAENVTFTAN
jgi:hypothetical protein